MYVQYVCIIKGLYTEHIYSCIYRCKCICNTKSYYGVHNTYVYMYTYIRMYTSFVHALYIFTFVRACVSVCIHAFEVDIAFSVSHGYWFTASDA